MEQHEISQGDLAAFMTELGIAIKKEGACLQSLARQWFEGSVEYDLARSISFQLDSLGAQVLAVKNHLCNKCLMLDVVTGVSIGKSIETEKEVAAKDSGEGKKV